MERGARTVLFVCLAIIAVVLVLQILSDIRITGR